MLTNAGYSFSVQASDLNEAVLKKDFLRHDNQASSLALLLAKAKARDVSQRFPAAYVIGSDQILTCSGKFYSKVKTTEEAVLQIESLQGRTHHLTSAAAIFKDGKCMFEGVDMASLQMRRLTTPQIHDYLKHVGNSVLGSVGCYQIEGSGIQLFDSIEGSNFTIMGMPLLQLLAYLRNIKIELQQ